MMTRMPRFRSRCVVVLMSALGTLACEPACAQTRPGAPPGTPPTDGLMDCSLYRYGSELDQVIATTLLAIGSRLGSVPTLQAASRSGGTVDVTEALRQQGFIHRVADCAEPVVRGFVRGQDVFFRVSALQSVVCQELVASERLRLAGMLVTPAHAPSGEARCGGQRNPIPNILTLGRLTQAGRMLPGDNMVTIVARGPFPEAPAVMARPATPKACPTIDGTPDPVIEAIIGNRTRLTTDYPRVWRVEPCFDMLGGPSSTGVCTTAQWNGYHDRLLDEFRRILAKAETSNDPMRIYSAAYWLIERSDPAKYTIKSFDYKNRECDVVRNRFVTACGLAAWDDLKKALIGDPRTQSVDRDNVPLAFSQLDEIMVDLATRVLPPPAGEAVRQCFAQYNQANSLTDQLTRPLPFAEYRLGILNKLQSSVHDAMQRIGHGDCPYYASAVMRLDRSIWRNQYEGGMTSIALVDWEHSFRQSALKCLTGR